MMMALLEVDPNLVKPGWIPLVITIVLAGVMVLLYLSMRRQFGRIKSDLPTEEEARAQRRSASSTPRD